MNLRCALAVLTAVALVMPGCGNGHAASGEVRVSGNIEVTDAEVSFKIPGRVQERMVDEGDAVELDQVVAQLDCKDLEQQVAVRRADVEAANAFLAELEAGARPQEIEQAKAAVDMARAQLDELDTGSREQEIAAAQADVQWAKAEYDRLTADFERYTKLYGEKVVPAQAYDGAKAAKDVAAARLTAAREKLDLVKEGPRSETIERAQAALKQSEERYAMVVEGPRKETIDQARARLTQAQEALKAAEIQLGYGTLSAPLSGVVLSKNVENGEYVSPGMPVITVAAIDQVWLRAYINETDLGRVKLGQKVEVSTDTFPDKRYEGSITFISSEAEFTPKSVQTEKERVKLVYRIKVRIDNPQQELKPGMPADGVIHLS